MFETIFWTAVITGITVSVVTLILSYRHHEQEKEKLRESIQMGHNLYAKIQKEVQGLIADAVKAGHSVQQAAHKILAAVGL